MTEDQAGLPPDIMKLTGAEWEQAWSDFVARKIDPYRPAVRARAEARDAQLAARLGGEMSGPVHAAAEDPSGT